MPGFVPPARVLIASLSGLCALIVFPGASHAAHAHTARTVNLSENARLHRTNRPSGVHLDEQGYASGTISGTIYIHLKVYANHVSAEVNIYPHGGSLTATGSAGYHVNGGYAPFSGTITVQRGTGTYAHASSGGLRFTGSIQRSNDSVTVQLSGRLSY
ncbi:MAG TPA: autotransporter [Solirubrobacteraceae bacterium]|jgi:hypothetical protein|nr:autotransporter [Solirubrobacteraceae bacterium]